MTYAGGKWVSGAGERSSVGALTADTRRQRICCRTDSHVHPHSAELGFFPESSWGDQCCLSRDPRPQGREGSPALSSESGAPGLVSVGRAGRRGGRPPTGSQGSQVPPGCGGDGHGSGPEEPGGDMFRNQPSGMVLPLCPGEGREGLSSGHSSRGCSLRSQEARVNTTPGMQC